MVLGSSTPFNEVGWFIVGIERAEYPPNQVVPRFLCKANELEIAKQHDVKRSVKKISNYRGIWSVLGIGMLIIRCFSLNASE